MQRFVDGDPCARLHIALIGTRGVPARYGGFETAVEEVGVRLVNMGHKVTVYCRGTSAEERTSEHLGMQLVHLPAFKRRSLETLSHTALSVVHASVHRPDAAIVFNAANAPLLPILGLSRIPFATHVDGLEWKRAKWGAMGRRYYLLCERLAVWWSRELISDAEGIAEYYRQKFAQPSRLISYGAPQLQESAPRKLASLGIEPGKYHLVVARFEPENHVAQIVEGYASSAARLPLVVVGSAPYAKQYTQEVHAAANDKVIFLGGVWDQKLLDELYLNALAYWHGHSVGGTNPSLLRALGAGTAINAFDVNFNREVAKAAGAYFHDSASAAVLFERTESGTSDVLARGQAAKKRSQDYNWDEVAASYEELCLDLAGKHPPKPSPVRAGRNDSTHRI